jgi:hypothetical protein
MPRFSRKSKRRTGDDKGIVEHLETGHCFDSMLNPDFYSDHELRAAWDKMRDVILSDFVRRHPGTRPWAWWKFDAPGRRERIDGGVHPHDHKERTLSVARTDNPDFWKVAYRLWFGLPSCFIPPYDNGLKMEMFEPEWSFLQRHNLLLLEDSP